MTKLLLLILVFLDFWSEPSSRPFSSVPVSVDPIRRIHGLLSRPRYGVAVAEGWTRWTSSDAQSSGYVKKSIENGHL